MLGASEAAGRGRVALYGAERGPQIAAKIRPRHQNAGSLVADSAGAR